MAEIQTGGSEPVLHVRRIGEICREFDLNSLLPQVRALTDTLSDGGIVDVAVLGQFKAGKSSFINSLVGREIMPVDVLPTTAVVTRIGYGPADRAVVRRLSGGMEEISPEAIAEFVTEKRNPGNRKQVDLVEVESPALQAFEGVRFVDTPGLGSIFRHNTQTSIDWLPRIGAAIVAISIDHPLSEQDLLLLEDIARHTPEILVMLTKADVVSEEEAARIIDFTGEQLKRRFSRRVPVLPFSIRPSYERLRDDLRCLLIHRVAENHEARFHEVVHHKFRALLSSCREYMSMSLRAATADRSALEELAALLEREQKGFGQIRNEIWLVAEDHKQRIRDAAYRQFGVQAEAVTDRIQSALKEKFKEWRGNLAETSAAFKEWLEETLEAEMKTLSLQGEDALAPHLAQAQAAIARAVRAFQDRLSRAIHNALHIEFAGAQFQGDMEEPSSPDVRIGKTFDIPIDMLWFVIPMAIFRPLVNRHILAKIPWEVEKNLSRLSAQWADASNLCLDNLARQAQGFIRNELAVVSRLVLETRDRSPEIRATLDEITALEGMGAPASAAGGSPGA